MTRYCNCLLLLLLCLSANNARGQREAAFAQLRTILEHEWQGAAKAAMPEGNTGQGNVFQRLYDIKFDSRYKYTGKQVTLITHKDGRQTWARSGIYGKLFYKEKNNRAWLSYNEDYSLDADSFSIKAGYVWCLESGTLDIYEDENRPGQYFLKGALSCPQSATRKVEFSAVVAPYTKQ